MDGDPTPNDDMLGPRSTCGVQREEGQRTLKGELQAILRPLSSSSCRQRIYVFLLAALEISSRDQTRKPAPTGRPHRPRVGDLMAFSDDADSRIAVSCSAWERGDLPSLSLSYPCREHPVQWEDVSTPEGRATTSSLQIRETRMTPSDLGDLVLNYQDLAVEELKRSGSTSFSGLEDEQLSTSYNLQHERWK